MLDKDQCNLIELICENNDIELRKDYSGRNMFGKECFGIVGNGNTLTKFFIDLTSSLKEFDDEQLAYELSYDLKTDNMGNDYIYYFPNWQWNNEEMENEEEEE